RRADLERGPRRRRRADRLGIFRRRRREHVALGHAGVEEAAVLELELLLAHAKLGEERVDFRVALRVARVLREHRDGDRAECADRRHAHQQLVQRESGLSIPRALHLWPLPKPSFVWFEASLMIGGVMASRPLTGGVLTGD